MAENQSNEPQEETKKEENPWLTIVYGLALIAGGAFLYYLFNKMENEGGSMRLNWILVLAYKLGGKWTVASILGLLGAITTYLGVSKVIKKN